MVYGLLIRNLMVGIMTMSMKLILKSNLIAMAAGFTMLVSAGAASAQSMERLSQADANGDGSISWQEMVDMRAGIFERLDRNGNGVADADDSPRFGPGKSRFDDAFGQMKNFDTNGDGRITKSEMLDAPSPLFEKGDTNNDKVLSADELAALRTEVEQK